MTLSPLVALAGLLLLLIVPVLTWATWRHYKIAQDHRSFHRAYGGEPKTGAYNPYLEARKEFNDRYGDLARGKRNWQIASLLLSLTICALGTGLAAVATQHRVQPYIVEVDEHGAVRIVGELPAVDPSDAMLRWHLQQWIRNARIVVSDFKAQDQYTELAYATVQGQARTALSEYYVAKPPKERSRLETVLIEAKQPRAISDTSYQLRWTEVSYGRSGSSRRTDHDAVVEVAIVPPKSDAERARNPLGIRIIQLDW